MAHTRGPWTYSSDPKNYGRDHYFILGDGGTILIAEMNNIVRHGVGKPADLLADARLLAVAPELLAMCRQVEAYCPMSVQDQIRALVKKALEG